VAKDFGRSIGSCARLDSQGDSDPRIALITPYSGGNFGDAAIQDSMIANMHFRLPNAHVSGISLNSDNFLRRHGVVKAFPLLAHMQQQGVFQIDKGEQATPISRRSVPHSRFVKRVRSTLKAVPLAWRSLRVADRVFREVDHFIAGYRFLREQDLLIVSGGGQLNEEYEGPWRHPFGLFKWAVMARLARVEFAVVSVGTGKVTSPISKTLISWALRMANYRSYRDEGSKSTVCRIMQEAKSDSIVPDLAFSLPKSGFCPPGNVRMLAGSRAIVAISPMAIGKPGIAPKDDIELYARYLKEMANIISQLLKQDHFLVLLISCLDEDQQVTQDLMNLLDADDRRRIVEQAYFPSVSTWQEFVASLKDVDLLIASRLHSIILSFVGGVPAIAVSPAAKVDSVMTDLGQARYLFKVDDFSCGDILEAVADLKQRKGAVLQEIAAHQRDMLGLAASQYDFLASLAQARKQTRRRDAAGAEQLPA
jgi:polysaccharide pyruvyl transferase WcaK-like protein